MTADAMKIKMSPKVAAMLGMDDPREECEYSKGWVSGPPDGIRALQEEARERSDDTGGWDASREYTPAQRRSLRAFANRPNAESMRAAQDSD
jgi:hypothetical protein